MSDNAFAALRVGELLRAARERDASDLHLGGGAPPAVRIDGTLEYVDDRPLTHADITAFENTLLGPSERAEIDASGDADAVVRDPLFGTIRIHAFRAGGSLRFAVRLLPSEIPTLDSLRLPAILATFSRRLSGMVMVVGPTGSGKSTAAAALVNNINITTPRHIVTIEDPIEFVHAPVRGIVSQREVGADTGDYARAVRSALRADPDVILIGELRESATMEAALTAAETGHLVITTLHTGDAAQTIDRIVDAFAADRQPEVRSQLARTLVGVASIRLVPRSGGGGRCAAVEVLTATDAVRSMIRDGKSHQVRNAIVTGRASGMQTLETHLSELVVRNVVTIDAARAATDRPGDVRAIVSYAS